MENKEKVNSENKDFLGKIKATIVIEILGRPPEHIKETLENMVGNIEAEKGVKVIEKKVNDAIQIEGQENMFSSFAEIDLEAETVMHMIMVVFKYMPSHIEITYPEKLIIKNNEWNEVFNEIGRRLHGYDEVARVIQIEKQILEKKLREVLEKQKDDEIKKNK